MVVEQKYSLITPEQFAGERFVTPITVISPRQHHLVVHEKRLYPLDSLARQEVVTGIVPNSIVMFDNNGAPWWNSNCNGDLCLIRGDQRIVYGKADLKEEGYVLRCPVQYDKIADFRAGIAVPVGVWGSDGVMVMDIGKRGAAPPQALIDSPRELLDVILRCQQRIIEQQLITGPVLWGVNNGVSIKDPGMRSVFRPHSQSATHPEFHHITYEEIKNIRNTTPWDEGLSKGFGLHVAEHITKEILPNFWEVAKVEPDNMGFTIDLPGFKPEHLGNVNVFIDKFLRPLSWIVFSHFEDYHRQIYKSEFKQVIEYVRSLYVENRKDLAYDDTKFDSFFQLRDDILENVVTNALLKLESQGAARHPADWSGSIFFNSKEDVTRFFFTASFMNFPMGAFEGLGMRLIRTKEPVPYHVMQQKSKMYENLVANAVVAF